MTGPSQASVNIEQKFTSNTSGLKDIGDVMLFAFLPLSNKQETVGLRAFVLGKKDRAVELRPPVPHRAGA